jgi:Family of unknown function (DUF6508)
MSTPTRTAADELVAFLADFERPDRGPIVTWVEPKHLADGSMTMPYPIYAEDVDVFFSKAGAAAWCDKHYTDKPVESWLADDAFIAGATLDQMKSMLTYCVRGERFCDGFWASLIERGRIAKLLRRLNELRETL